LERKLTTGALTHRLIVAADTEREEFHARDTAFAGFTNQDRTRRHDSIAGEWRAETDSVAADIAVRHDSFNRFKDATTFRASLLGQLGHGFALAGSYGEGIAQPTFFDLYGFFPGSFVGNPDLKPESSRGFELSLRYRRGAVGASLTGYRQRLRDEIVNNATFTSVINAAGQSKRSGVEATLYWQPSAALRLSANYAYLKSTQLDALSGDQLTEVRRPKYSGAVAIDGRSGALTYGASIAYVGKHLDNRDVFPFDRVTLGSYWLVDARVAYSVRPGVELFARGSNLLNQRYQDVYSYRTNPRGVFGGVRLSR
jgi:vitamin B12 transporter